VKKLFVTFAMLTTVGNILCMQPIQNTQEKTHAPYLAAASKNGTIRIWDVEKEEVIKQVELPKHIIEKKIRLGKLMIGKNNIDETRFFPVVERFYRVVY